MTVATRLSSLFFASPLYRLTLKRRTPKEVLGTPPDPWPGNSGTADILIRSSFAFGAPRPAAGEEVPWFMARDSASAAAALHGFSWLRDLRTLGSDAARSRARALTLGWIGTHGRWQPLPWRPEVLATRLCHWFANYGFLTAGADESSRAALLGSIGAQVLHLRRTIASAPPDHRLLEAVKGLLYAGVCLAGEERTLEAGLKLLDRELARQVLPDGGHIERCPSIHLDVLRHLVDLRGTLAAAHQEVPVALQSAIDRLSPMARTFRHGDGRLALFNGGNEEDDKDLSMVLAQSGARGKAISTAPHSGFHRLAAGRSLVIVDAGKAVPGADARAHAGTLSFEMSVGRDRMVVNCGYHGADEAEWRRALAATAAHSTVALGETSSSEILPEGGIGRRPHGIEASRREADGNIWLECSHDGYREPLGIVHHRHLYLSHDGNDFRGMDLLEGRPGPDFAARFHLHPLVQSSLVMSGTQVLLKLPGGSGWRFIAAGAKLGLEDSVYLGTRRTVRRCRQIVLSGRLKAAETTIKWAFHREAG